MESDPESDLTTEPSNLIKAEYLWFEDGNIVLQAKNTLFKVYRGILIRESTVFDDMFSLPQPDVKSKSAESYEDCQLVQMHDEASDLARFLNAIFDFEYLGNIVTCSDYAIILRMATKYQADQLRKRVIQTLLYVYPDTLKGYDEVKSAGKYHPDTHPLQDLELDDTEGHFALINAARDTEALLLLPAAMLRVFTRGIPFIVQGTLADSDVSLDPVNKNAILSALPALAKLSRRYSFSALYNDELSMSPDCELPAHCHKYRRKLLNRYESPYTAYIVKPFAPVPFTSGKIALALCTPCRIMFKTSYDTGRIKAWEELPKAFGLPTWADMHKLAAEDSGEDDPMEGEGGEAQG